MRSTVRAADYISNRKPEDLLDSCVDYLDHGRSLLLFPEGTRTRHNGPIEFKPGAATVAARSGVDILPIAIQCEPMFLSKQHAWHYIPREKPRFTIRILAPRRGDELAPAGDDERHRRHVLSDALLALLEKELDDMAFSEQPI
jgi:1-acyl-sn-glycerol-3-phosphate acyltransferase